MVIKLLYVYLQCKNTAARLSYHNILAALILLKWKNTVVKCSAPIRGPRSPLRAFCCKISGNIFILQGFSYKYHFSVVTFKTGKNGVCNQNIETQWYIITLTTSCNEGRWHLTIHAVEFYLKNSRKYFFWNFFDYAYY